MNFRKFCIKHLNLLTVIPSIVFGVALSMIFYPDPAGAAYGGAGAVILMFLISFAIRRFNLHFMKAAEKKLNDECDPYPTIDELKLYIECAGRRMSKTGLNVTLAMMKTLSGDFAGAEELFRSFDVDDASALPDEARAGILYNLSSLYCSMNLPAHAVDCYDRAKALFSSLAESRRERMKFDGPTDAEVECYKGNVSQALEMLGAIEPENRFHETVKRFALAKVLYIAGKRDEARREFDWVAKNGGRLNCAEESAEILDAMEKAE